MRSSTRASRVTVTVTLAPPFPISKLMGRKKKWKKGEGNAGEKGKKAVHGEQTVDLLKPPLNIPNAHRFLLFRDHVLFCGVCFRAQPSTRTKPHRACDAEEARRKVGVDRIGTRIVFHVGTVLSPVSFPSNSCRLQTILFLTTRPSEPVF